MEAMVANMASISAEIRDRNGEPASRWLGNRLCIAPLSLSLYLSIYL